MARTLAPDTPVVAAAQQPLRVLVLSTHYFDAVDPVSAEQIRPHFEAVASLIKELSFGKVSVLFSFGDLGAVYQSPETLTEWSTTARVLNKVFYDVHPDGKAECDLNELLPLAQQYLDSLSDDDRRRSGILISTLNLGYVQLGISPCQYKSIGELALWNMVIPTQYNINDFDVLLFSIFDDTVHSGGLQTRLSALHLWQSNQLVDRWDKKAIMVGALPLILNNYWDWLQDDYVPVSIGVSRTVYARPPSKYARTVAHELMHALGAGHDFGLNFYTDPSLARQINANPRLAYAYNSLEYGDWFSIAGSADYKYALGLSAATRDLLGWLAADRVHVITSTTPDVHVADINSAAGRTAAKVRVDGGWMYATYHAGTGYEGTLRRPELLGNTRGLQLHFFSDERRMSVLLDPDGNVRNHDFALKPGESFSVLGVEFTRVHFDSTGPGFDVIYAGN